MTNSIDQICADLKAVPELKDGFNAIGFSQGGLFFRGYVERCNDPPVTNLITFGSPHQGTSDIPTCDADNVKCNLMRSLVKTGVYWDWVQKSVVQAQYYKDFNNLDKYRQNSLFLPDINDEIEMNSKYASRMKTLNRLVLIKFAQDEMIVPKESAHFGYYDDDKNIVSVEKQLWFERGSIGLRDLFVKGRIAFLELPGGHMKFSLEEFRQITERYLIEPLIMSNDNPSLFEA